MNFLLLGLLALLVLSLAAALFPVILRVNRHRYVAQALAFPVLLPLLTVFAGLLCGLLWFLTGTWFWFAAGGVLLGGFLISLLRIAWLGFRRDVADRGDDEIVVLGWNTLGDSVPVTTLRDAILAHRPDVVGLPETTVDHQVALVMALTEAGYPVTGYTVGPQDGHTPHETSLLIRADYGAYTAARLHVLGASTLEATPAQKDMPTFVAVHTVAPILTLHRAWVADLRLLTARYLDRTRTILVGDFNATVTHMRGLGAGVLGDLVDAAATRHAAASGTWPVSKSPLLGTQIDHVLHTADYLTTGFTVLTEYDGTGSDHRPVLARLTARR